MEARSGLSGWDELSALFENSSADQLCHDLTDKIMNDLPAKTWKTHEHFAVDMLMLTKEFITFARKFSSIEPEHKVAITELEATLRELVQKLDQKTAPKPEENLTEQFKRESDELLEVVHRARLNQASPETKMIIEQFEREVPDWRNRGKRGKLDRRVWEDFLKSHTSKDGKWWWDGSQWRPTPNKPAR